MKWIFLTLITSCTMIRVPFFKKNDANFAQDFKEYEAKDYLNHWKNFKTFLKSSDEITFISISNENQKYLKKISDDIMFHNEIFFIEKSETQFNVIANPLPFHFSLPGNIIFLSSGLINKYIKHEGILVSIIAYELIRSQKGLYNKTIIIPTGNLSLERMLSLNRLMPNLKTEIHKWAYHFLKRVGYDGEYYLSWLQIQNRNTSDFYLMQGDNSNISYEEAYFKDFLVKRSKISNNDFILKKNSSKNFYQFLFFIKDKTV